jgi:hypothetical protein
MKAPHDNPTHVVLDLTPMGTPGLYSSNEDLMETRRAVDKGIRDVLPVANGPLPGFVAELMISVTKMSSTIVLDKDALAMGRTHLLGKVVYCRELKVFEEEDGETLVQITSSGLLDWVAKALSDFEEGVEEGDDILDGRED